MNEFSFINSIYRKLGPDSKKFSGDDAAFIKCRSNDLLVSKDLLVENIHFNLSYSAPEDIGYKAVSVNLSDITACGGNPRYLLIGFAFPQKKMHIMKKICTGAAECAHRYKCLLIGGDTTASRSDIFISITAIGQTDNFIKRSGSNKGDLIYITDYTGFSAAGLIFLQEKIRPADFPGMEQVIKTCIHNHRRPEPEIKKMRKLIAGYRISSMIDISDGLSSELYHLYESNKKKYGLQINESALFCPAITSAGKIIDKIKKKRNSALELALHGGEDYRLLFTSPDLIPRHLALKIGTVVSEKKIFSIGSSGRKKIECLGYNHFF
ncbi:MAG TPA: thiamine-phosphate kinase [Spirochaetia bacterium]|nr:thiamine-phosphate kinase [Spirochaetia bacterium]